MLKQDVQRRCVEDPLYFAKACLPKLFETDSPSFHKEIIEAMIDAGVHIGMSRDMASELVLQTVLGSARFAQTSGKHPAELRNMVTSPGGTTAEGLLQLEEAGLRAILNQAVVAAYEKAKKLGKEQK